MMSPVLILFMHYTFIILNTETIKLATFNTAQLGSPYTIIDFAEAIQSEQWNQIIQSNIDIICLQELGNPQIAYQYKYALSQSYPYSHSELDQYNPTNVINCDQSQYDSIRGSCITQCDTTYGNADGISQPGIDWIKCLVDKCETEAFPLLYTNCIYCVGYYPTVINPTAGISEAAFACANYTMPPFNLVDGTAIYSKNKIVNKWYFTIPSDATIQRALTMAQIKMCPPNKKCTDTIIVGCLHLVATDNTMPYIPGDQGQKDNNIQTNTELNAYQIQYLIDNILNEDSFPWKTDHKNRVKALFIAGDLNIGNMLYPENLDIWKDNGFTDTSDLYNLNFIDDGCTYCADKYGTDMFNRQAFDWCSQIGCDLIDSDLDHILIYNNNHEDSSSEIDIGNINPISYKRVFNKLFAVSDGELIELSDHWGVQFKFKSRRDSSSGSGDDAVVQEKNAINDENIVNGVVDGKYEMITKVGVILVLVLLWS
eukprot:233129_1